MLWWELLRNDRAESHTADFFERAKSGAGRVGGAFVRLKRPSVIVGGIF